MKFRLTISKIEMEFEAENIEDAEDKIHSGEVDVTAEMFNNQKLEQIHEDKTIHKLVQTYNQFNNLDPENRQWWCLCNRIFHTETDAHQHLNNRLNQTIQ